jgi:DNA polymerase
MVVAMYHPAAALHQPSLRNVVKEDFAKLPSLMKKAQAARQTSTVSQDANLDLPGDDPAGNDQPEQLSLF